MLNPRKAMNLHSDQEGVALTEFALTLPLFLILIMGGLEVTNLALVHLRLNHIAEATADNASRISSQMDENDIAEIFAGVQKEGTSIDFANKGDVVLSSVEDNKQTGTKQGQTIRWQRCYGKKKIPPAYGKEGKGKSDNAMKKRHRTSRAPGRRAAGHGRHVRRGHVHLPADDLRRRVRISNASLRIRV